MPIFPALHSLNIFLKLQKEGKIFGIGGRYELSGIIIIVDPFDLYTLRLFFFLLNVFVLQGK